jgi:hypothetical protein
MAIPCLACRTTDFLVTASGISYGLGNTYVTMALYFTETCIAPVGNGQASRYIQPDSSMVQQQQESIISASAQTSSG